MNAIVKQNGNQALAPEIIESLVIGGDLGGLNNQQRVAYYNYRCQQVGLDPSAKPFDVLKLSGKTVLYANAGCTQQLCQIHKLSVSVTSREKIGDIYCVTARVASKIEDRATENMGTVPLTYPEKYYDKNAGKMLPHPKAGQPLTGDDLANAMLKCVTKAIRRTVLAHCGLGMLDETEVETIPGAQTEQRGRGNPLRQDFAAWNAEIAAAKSQEQLDLILGSPEFAEFKKACDEQHARGGMHFADMLFDQAESLKKKLPERIHFEGNKIVATTETEAVMAEKIEDDRLSEETTRILDRIDVAESENDLKAVSADVKGMNIPDAEKPIINKAYKQRKATIAAKVAA